MNYIVIPHWDGPDGFQHYHDRRPNWIKNYVALMSKPEYATLSFADRGLLHGLWLLYAESSRNIIVNTLYLSRQLSGRVTKKSLERLNHAGFIEFSASRPLAPRYQDASPEREKRRIEAEIDQSLQESNTKAGLLPLLEDVARAREDHDASGLPFSQSLGDLVKPIVAHEIDPVLALLKELDDADSGTETILRAFRLPEYAYRQAIETCQQRGHRTALAVSVLQRVQDELEAQRSTNGKVHADDDIPL
jgi:hypothetical protein